MQWLIAHMWTALVAAGALAFLFGWAARGLGLRGKLRRAEGERNIAVGTLQEKEAELEAFYAGGRTPSTSEAASENDDRLRVELASREAKLQALADELARSRAELNELRGSAVTDTAAAGAVGAAVAATATAIAGNDEPARLDEGLDKEEASLEWRNRYLESQVRTLQDKVQELSAAAETGGTAVVEAASVAAVTEPVGAGDTDPVDVTTAKLKWQNDYLRQRLQYLEAHGGSQASGSAAVAAASAAGVGVAEIEDDAPGATASVSDEEIAKLRWRNRYLEGRLAYYEADKEDEVDASATVASEAATVDGVTEDIVKDQVFVEEDVAEFENIDLDAEIEEIEEDAGDFEVDDAVEETDDVEEESELEFDEDDLSEIDEAELEEIAAVELEDTDFENDDNEESGELDETDEIEDEEPEEDDLEVEEVEEDEPEDAPEIGEKPLALEGPVDGEGDDLTAIGGIGPKIEKVLNELGIYHFDQIAAWTKDNIDWVDDYLSFKGRIEREQWVQQAAALSGDDFS